MKKFLPFVIAGLLAWLLLGATSAQDAPVTSFDHKRAQLIPATDAPWGLAVEFAPGTTSKAAGELKERYHLVRTGGGWEYASITDTLLYSATAALTDYTGDESSHYFGEYLYGAGKSAVTGCWIDNTCPPIYVVGALFEPVDGTTEAALLADPMVSRLDNRRSTPFFFLKLLERWMEGYQHSRQGVLPPATTLRA